MHWPASKSMCVSGRIMRQTIWITISVLLLAMALSSSSVHAEDPPEKGIVLTPGQWIFDVEIRMPMQTVPTVERFRSCTTNDPITVSTLMPWAESQGCKIRSVRAVEDKLTWKLRCKISGQTARGRGEFKADGDHAEGKASVHFEMGGRSLSIVTKWDAKRIGDCSETNASDSTP